MPDTPYLDVLLGVLSRVAAIAVSSDTEPTTVVISAYEERDLLPAVRLEIDELTLQRYVSQVGDDARAAFGPATPRDRAAVQLLSVHIQEMILTRKGDRGTLVLTSSGVTWDH